MEFTPELTTKDWNAEWKQLQQARNAADDPSQWDERAKSYHKAALPASPYVREFIAYADVQPGDSVFDMGAGTGAVSIPLAAEGHQVLACDFSDGMLSVLRQEADRHGIAIDTKLLSWADDWEAHGVLPRSFDIATASRSIATGDLGQSLAKLSAVARRRCNITLAVGSSPRIDQEILSAIGLQSQLGRDFVYAFIILLNMGYKPEVNYILSTRYDTYESEEEAYRSLERMVRDAARTLPDQEMETALANLRPWLSENLVENPKAGERNIYDEVEGPLRLKNPRKATWADIAWNV